MTAGTPYPTIRLLVILSPLSIVVVLKHFQTDLFKVPRGEIQTNLICLKMLKLMMVIQTKVARKQ